MASSRCHEAVAVLLNVVGSQAAATASRHVFIAAVRSTRWARAKTRWRWVLKIPGEWIPANSDAQTEVAYPLNFGGDQCHSLAPRAESRIDADERRAEALSQFVPVRPWVRNLPPRPSQSCYPDLV